VIPQSVVNLLIALVPVVAFLAVLFFMDSFRLVGPESIASAMVWGGIAAAASLWINSELLDRWHVPTVLLTRCGARGIGGGAKALLMFVLVATGRLGFLVAAAIKGFAVGTGFAVAENLTSLHALPDASLALWLVRGIGTAVLQGGATAIFAM